MQQFGFTHIHYLLCCLLAFVIPFPFVFAPVVIILIAIAWLLSGNWRGFFPFLKRSPVLLAWLLFYALHIASYFYSHNKDVAAFELERKLSCAVLPVVLYAPFYENSRRFSYLLLSFMTGLSVIALWCLARAAFLYAQDGQTGHFFYHSLAQGTDANAVYTSWYVVCALALLFFLPWQKNGVRFPVFWRWCMGILLGIFLILLNSRLLLVLFVALLLPVYFQQLALRRKLSKSVIVLLSVFVISAVSLVAFTKNPVSKRFHEVLNKKIDQAFYPDYRQRDQSFNNLTLRLFVWRVGVDNLSEHQLWLFGTGIGDWSEMQDRRMDALGIEHIYDTEHPSQYRGVNLHNMYIQSLVALGIPGLLLMLYLAFWPLGMRIRWPEKKVFLIIMAVSALFMLQEAALQTQAGVLFYVFISVLIYIRYRAVKKGFY